MKASADTINPVTSEEKTRYEVFTELIKARLTSLVLLTTLVGFYMGSTGRVEILLMIHTLLATGLLAGGAAALNQFMEHELDSKMRRTQDRPRRVRASSE